VTERSRLSQNDDRVPLVRGPQGKVFVPGVVIPRIWGPGIEGNSLPHPRGPQLAEETNRRLSGESVRLQPHEKEPSTTPGLTDCGKTLEAALF